MEHLQIAYDILVIVIGFAALSIAFSWSLKTGESDLRSFCITYALFTLLLVVLVLKKYLFLNVEGYSALSWYVISGIHQILNFAVIVAALFFLLGVYQVGSRRVITMGFLLAALLCYLVIFSPLGTILDAENGTIRLGTGFQTATVWYLVSFTSMIVLGYGLLPRVWQTDKRNFVIGFLVFATIGYVETLINLPESFRNTEIAFSGDKNFLFSSIPYAVYGIFLINHFLHYPAPVGPISDEPSEDFLSKYALTDREREVIRKVMQGKSNADIASDLFISPATVKTHLHNIFRKIGVNSRYELLARIRAGK